MSGILPSRRPSAICAVAYKRANTQKLIPGEPLYAVKPGTFPAVFVKIGRVKGTPKSVDEGLRNLLRKRQVDLNA
jgi:hypothetical protein